MTTDSAPAPLTPAECDLSDFDRMSIDIKRLRGSKFDAMLDDQAWRAGLNLWISAWHARPAASLDDDEETLAVAAGLRDIPKWRKLRDKALRGFVKCADGRLYHTTLSEIALEAWIEKLMQRRKSGAGNEARWGAKFDAEQIDADIDDACAHLAKLNPDSKTLAKVKRKRDKPTPRGNGGGGKTDPAGNPTGTQNTSHRDQKTVPQGVPQGSQENGTDKNKGRSITTPPSAQTSARATDPPPHAEPDAPPPPSCGAVWRDRIAEADARLGDRLNTTVSATRHAAALKALCEPPDGAAPCAWADVLDALDAVASQCAARGEQLRSFAHPAIAPLARQIRDLRLNGTPETDHDRRNGPVDFAGRSRPANRGMVGAVLRAEVGAGGLAEPEAAGNRHEAEAEHRGRPARYN